MSFDPKKFINISKELQSGNTEEYYRSIVNRAYYSAFGYIKIKYSIYNIGAGVHKEAIDKLMYSPVINEKKAGKILESLFKKRKEADYNYNTQVSKFAGQFSISEAEKIISLIDPK